MRVNFQMAAHSRGVQAMMQTYDRHCGGPKCSLTIKGLAGADWAVGFLTSAGATGWLANSNFHFIFGFPGVCSARKKIFLEFRSFSFLGHLGNDSPRHKKRFNEPRLGVKRV